MADHIDIGLSWKRFDLHVHTPASKCFKGTSTPEEIVEKALSMDLDAIAITDHNTSKWIDDVKTVAKTKGLVVFPGVEITCIGGIRGIHILCLMDPSATSGHINNILNLSGIDPDNYGLQETISDKSPTEIIDIIEKNNGLAVLAHANSTHGLLSDMSGGGRTRAIQNPALLAAECTDFFDERKKEEKKRVYDYLDGSDPTYKRNLAVYQASDNPCPDQNGMHCVEGIGSRFSYFKVQEINLDSLRQCFIDPDVRIRQEGENLQAHYPYIKQVKINSGFLDGQEINFHPGLTSILGGKGTGKSLLIEFIRFALNQESTIESIRRDHLGKLKNRLGEFGSVQVTYKDENGKESNVLRTFREIDNSLYDESVPYDPAQVFPVLFLSQNEIVKIAENENDQLQFIDQFFDFHSYRSQIQKIENELSLLDKSMSDSLRAYSEAEQLSIKLATVNKEISRLDIALKAPVFEDFQLIEDKKNNFQAQIDYISLISETIEKTKATLLTIDTPAISVKLSKDPSLLRNRKLLNKSKDKASEVIDSLLKEIKINYQSAVTELTTWHPKYLEGKKKYEDHIQQIGGDYKAIAVTRGRFIHQKQELEQNLKSIIKRRDNAKDISQKREAHLDDLLKTYENFSSERREKCKKFEEDSDGKLMLQILDQSNVEEFEKALLSLKRGSYLRDDEITTIAAKVKPRDFVISLLRYDATKEAKHLQTIIDASSIELDRMKILADFLLSAIDYESLLSLQYRAHPQDRPEILFDIGDNNFQSISNISVGQKCTAMLLMALSDGQMPIIIDQPEDSLDIRSVWDDMCSKIRLCKDNRQFIFTTHNSSLAVASDTDCYLILEGDATSGEIVHFGSLDHDPVTSEVMQYLEGGKKTYSLKHDKYGRPLNRGIQ